MNTAHLQSVEHDNQAVAGHEHRPVDLVHLSRQAMGDKDLENEVLRLYAHQAEMCVNQLRAADNARSWLEAAHALKGSARGIGAWKVADDAAVAERHDFIGQTGDVEPILIDIAKSVKEANDFIGKILNDI